MKQGGQAMQDQIQKRIEAALSNEQIPDIYFHAFVSSLTPMGDALIVLERHGRPVARLICSYPVAKTLTLKLNDIVRHLEAQLGADILTTDQLAEALIGGGDHDDGSDS